MISAACQPLPDLPIPIMFEDAIKAESLEGKLAVKDVSELLLQNVACCC